MLRASLTALSFIEPELWVIEVYAGIGILGVFSFCKCDVDIDPMTLIYTVFQKKTSTHIIGYKLRNGCPILIIFDTKIPHII